MRRRERYAVEGGEGVGDAELVALVLETGASGRGALQIAAELLERFGGLPGLASRQPHELRDVGGIGLARAVRLHAALTAGRRSYGAGDRELPVTDPAAAFAWLSPALRGLVDEELHALYLDRRRRPVARRCLTRGNDGFTVVDPRQVFRVAVGVGASGVILAHNHPSGDPTPSPQDRDVTSRVAQAGRVLGIPLLDHLVVGGDRYVSLAAEGELPSWSPIPPSWTA